MWVNSLLPQQDARLMSWTANFADLEQALYHWAILQWLRFCRWILGFFLVCFFFCGSRAPAHVEKFGYKNSILVNTDPTVHYVTFFASWIWKILKHQVLIFDSDMDITVFISTAVYKVGLEAPPSLHQRPVRHRGRICHFIVPLWLRVTKTKDKVCLPQII